MTNIEKILADGYEFVKSDSYKYAVNVINPSGEKNCFSFGCGLKRNLFFGVNKIGISEKELFEYLFSITDEEMCQWKHGYSLRTLKYFEELKSEIGYVGEEVIGDSGVCDCDFEKTEFFYSETHNYIDDWEEQILYFNHKPTNREIRIAKIIAKSDAMFKVKKWREYFKCWECGVSVHWLDIKGDIFKKIDCMEDRYCGC